MGLDTTHGCWHGACSAFNRWRTEIAKQAGIPLQLMEGYYRDDCIRILRECDRDDMRRLLIGVPIPWESLAPDPLHALLNHSDCDGSIRWQDCEPIARRLKDLIDKLPRGDGGGHIRDWRETTQEFIDGLMRAHEAREDVEFHWSASKGERA